MDKKELSSKIFQQLYKLEDFLNAKSILIYLNIKSEVRTKKELDFMLSLEKKIVVPYVNGLNLELFHLENIDELEKGSFGVLEPVNELRQSKEKKIEARIIDLAIIPGVAFDEHGSRLGYGKGFYDRFLKGLRTDCINVGVAYQCQVFDSIPQEDHDISLDMLITEQESFSSNS